MSSPIRSRRSGVNVPPLERVLTTGLGAALVALGIRRRGLGGWLATLAGGAIAARGVTGVCAVSRQLTSREEVRVRRAITIQRPRPEIYRLWRKLDNLPKFLAHVSSVRLEGATTSHWEVKEGPLTLRWTAELMDDVPDHYLRWRSLPGGDLDHEGELELRDAPGGRGTEVHVTLRYRPPAVGWVGLPVQRLLARITRVQLGSELVRLRQLLETGELATGASRPGEAEHKELLAAKQVGRQLAAEPVDVFPAVVPVVR